MREDPPGLCNHIAQRALGRQCRPFSGAATVLYFVALAAGQADGAAGTTSLSRILSAAGWQQQGRPLSRHAVAASGRDLQELLDTISGNPDVDDAARVTRPFARAALQHCP